MQVAKARPTIRSVLRFAVIGLSVVIALILVYLVAILVWGELACNRRSGLECG